MSDNPFLRDRQVMAFTASVMGNPEYHKSTKEIVQAKDQRQEGLEAINPIHKAKLAKLAEKVAQNGK